MSLRQLEQDSIRFAVQKAATDGLLSGKVFDFGAGLQPHRWIVEAAGGDYRPYDRPVYPGSVVVMPVGDLPRPGEEIDAILCTQVIQYVTEPQETLEYFKQILTPARGHLLLTGPTNWPVVEKEDLYRFTVEGIRLMLVDAEFGAVQVEQRAAVTFEGETWSLGWTARGQA